MRKLGIIAVLAMLVVALAAVPALAQSGHFVTGGGNTPIASGPDDFGDLDLSGKVAGLGGTTFEIEATADATAEYACQNRGGEFPNDPRKQSVSGPVSDTTGPQPTPRNGQFKWSLTLEEPASTLTCPGGQVVVLVSVSYTNITVSLFEDDVLSDSISFPDASRTYFTDVP
jgi:hypothetical protein